jgi:hypothetical protein
MDQVRKTLPESRGGLMLLNISRFMLRGRSYTSESYGFLVVTASKIRQDLDGLGYMTNSRNVDSTRQVS